MPTEDRPMENPPTAAHLPERIAEGSSEAVTPVSRTWIILGSIALLLGLVMGILMSSLGR